MDVHTLLNRDSAEIRITREQKASLLLGEHQAKQVIPAGLPVSLR